LWMAIVCVCVSERESERGGDSGREGGRKSLTKMERQVEQLETTTLIITDNK
jgi:hypothetical protein